MHQMQSAINFPLVNVDSSLNALADHDVTGRIIDAIVSVYSFRNFDEIPKRLPHVLELCTKKEHFWRELIAVAARRYRVRDTGQEVLLFEQSPECGFLRTFRFRPEPSWALSSLELADGHEWVTLANEGVLYDLLDCATAKAVHQAWNDQKTRATDLPAEFVNGRLANTTVGRAVVLSRGEGCVVCGSQASCYAATTMGEIQAPLLIHLPMCPDHLADAKAHPTIFQFVVELLQQSVELPDLTMLPSIPDDLVGLVHRFSALGLGAEVGYAKKGSRGWELSMPLVSGWRWLLRINSFTDYCYLLFEPNQKKPAYKADSAPHHRELKFFPDHEHSRPDRNSDRVAPSFLYGHPLLDIKRLHAVGIEKGALATDAAS
jgi:hypothetical protein